MTKIIKQQRQVFVQKAPTFKIDRQDDRDCKRPMKSTTQKDLSPVTEEQRQEAKPKNNETQFLRDEERRKGHRTGRSID